MAQITLISIYLPLILSLMPFPLIVPLPFLVFWVEKIQKTPDFIHEVTQGKKKRRRATEQLHAVGEGNASPSHLAFEGRILFRQPYHNPLHLGELPTNTP